MPGGGQRWENRHRSRDERCAPVFPPLPTALGKRSAFPTFLQRRRFLILYSHSNKKGPRPPDSPTSVQAHPSMRIC